MKKNASFLLLFFLILNNSTSIKAQSCPDCRFASYVFDSVEVISNIKFGEGMNADGDLQELYLDIYLPYGDTMALRPVSIFAFGGAFIQGDRNEEYVGKTCKRFARAGYVGVGIDYRIGFDPLGVLLNPNEELMRTFFRAMQDMRAAIQFIRADVDILGNNYGIDTNAILIGGASAGGITASMVAYCDTVTEFEEMGNINAISSLGGFYSSSGMYPGYSWKVDGVFSIAGALVNADWIETGDAKLFTAHGDQDLTVPYDGGNFGIGPISIGLEGSYAMQQAAEAAGVCAYLYTIVGGDHPSGNEPEEYYQQIFHRALPRTQAALEGRSFCCSFTAEITQGDQLQVAPGQPLTLNASVFGTPAPSYLWCESQCTASGSNSTFTYTPSVLRGFATVMVTDSNCTATDFIQLDQLPLVSQNSLAELGIDLYPNPAQGQAWLRFDPNRAWAGSLNVYSLDGKPMLSNLIVNGKSMEFDLAAWPAGMYILELKTKHGLNQFKLMVK